MKLKSNIIAAIAVTVVCGFIAQQNVSAKGSATDTSTLPSNKPAAGGGGKSSAPTPAPTPAPAPAPTPVLSSGPVTFTPAGPVNGGTPVCTGDYRIGAYYPTLLDMTVNVSVSSLNVPDGTVLYVRAIGTVGTFYPYTSNSMVVTAGSALCSEKIFVGVGVGLAGVTITDASGAIIFAGN